MWRPENERAPFFNIHAKPPRGGTSKVKIRQIIYEKRNKKTSQFWYSVVQLMKRSSVAALDSHWRAKETGWSKHTLSSWSGVGFGPTVSNYNAFTADEPLKTKWAQRHERKSATRFTMPCADGWHGDQRRGRYPTFQCTKVLEAFASPVWARQRWKQLYYSKKWVVSNVQKRERKRERKLPF